MTGLLIALVKFALLLAAVAVLAVIVGAMFAFAQNRWKRLKPLPQSVVDHDALDADEARRDLERGSARTRRTIDDREPPGDHTAGAGDRGDSGDGGGGGDGGGD